MDQLLRLFDLFNSAAKDLAVYMPQSGPEVLDLVKNTFAWIMGLDSWLGATFGVSMQKFAEVLFKILITAGEFLLELIKQIANRA